MRLSKLVTTLWFLVGVISIVNAQDPASSQSAPTGLTLEVVYHKDLAPAFNPISREKAGGGWFTLFGRVPDWKLPEGQLPVQAVKVYSRLSGENVTVTVSVFRGVKFHDEEVSVGNYNLRENESVSIKELTQFGVEPFRLRVARVDPVVPPQPVVESRAKSLEVVGIEPVSSTLPAYKLTLHNLSEKNISAFEIVILEGDRVVESSWPRGTDDLPLIKAGDFYEKREPLFTRAERTTVGYAPDLPRSQHTVISCVVFEDGTYEGDSKSAALFRALTLGRKLALTRMLAVFGALDRTVAGTADLSAQLKRFRDQTLSVSEEPDRSTLAELQREFPTVELKTNEPPRTWLEGEIHHLKIELLKDLDGVAKSPSFNSSGFREWLIKTEDKYRTWLTRLAPGEMP